MSAGRPILVTGAHRSGTTWLGHVLGASPEILYVHEPFNANYADSLFPIRFPHHHFYVCKENERGYAPLFDDLLALRPRTLRRLRWVRKVKHLRWVMRVHRQMTEARRSGVRPMMKDPLALFSAPWLAERYDAQVLVMIRHPLAFAGSLKKAKWSFEFNDLLRQPLLMRDLLGMYEEPIRAAAAAEQPIVDQAILLWNIMYHLVNEFRRQHDDWLFVRHEDISLDPPAGFARIFDWLGVQMDDAVRGAIEAHSFSKKQKDLNRVHEFDLERDSRMNVVSWQSRLTPQEAERVLTGTAEVAGAFYEDYDALQQASAVTSA